MKFDQTTKVLLGIIGAGVWAVIIILLLPHAQINKVAEAAQAKQLSPKTPRHWEADYNVLTVHRLNIVNKKGQLQWVISDNSHFPPPIINGKAYPGARSISPHGVIIYDSKGNETGGIVNTVSGPLVIIDYNNSDGMGFGISDNRPEGFNAGFFIRDPVPLDESIFKRKGGSVNTVRVQLRDHNGNAELILRDQQGQARIKLAVTKEGKAFIKILDASGHAVKRLPHQ